MRLSLRFVIPLLAALAIFAYAALPLVDKLMLRWFGRDLEVRASLIANTVDDPLQTLLRSGNRSRVLEFFTRITQDERLLALAFCPADTSEPVATPMLPAEVQCSNLGRFATPTGELLQTGTGPVFVSVRELPGGQLVLVHDMSWFARRSRETRQYFFLFFVGLGLTVAFITVVIAQLSWRGWVQGLRGLLRGEGLVAIPGRSGARGFSGPPPELRPIAKDLRALIDELEADHRSRDDEQLVWTPVTLRQILRRELRGKEVIVVSNREPYIHVRRGDEIEVWRPASGLVTALEPIMRACSGTWIAHGSGGADRETVDARDRVAVPPPPDAAAYELRRVWLTREEEAGYYYGFANERIWPLCHIAHVRPVFRRADWEQYVAVNRKFAQTVIEVAQSADPIVLVQDYHFALLPRMIKEVLLSATIISFWHIPWPNPEAFAICPWREELLDGLLGSTILGFHTQFHVNNFVDTVDRVLEARINERFPAATHPPIILKIEHHQPDEIFEYYRGADLCMVTSLHDGMNLVAKEFVSARDDERGVLILSLFTGAARELPEALIVNPYDTDQCAAALQLALTMTSAEQRTRMRLMRGLIQDFNVFRWAGRMLMDAAAMRRRGRLPDVIALPTAQWQQGAALKQIGRR